MEHVQRRNLTTQKFDIATVQLQTRGLGYQDLPTCLEHQTFSSFCAVAYSYAMCLPHEILLHSDLVGGRRDSWSGISVSRRERVVPFELQSSHCCQLSRATVEVEAIRRTYDHGEGLEAFGVWYTWTLNWRFPTFHG